MMRRILPLARAAIAVWITGCAALGGPPSRPGATDTPIAYIRGGRLQVITAAGRPVLTYPRPPMLRLPIGQDPACDYRDAAVRPDSSHVSVIEDCRSATSHNVQILAFDLTAPRSSPRVLYAGTGRGLALPAWSSDGRRLAFLEMDDLVACAADCRMTFRTRLPRTHGEWTQLAWQPDGRRVLLRAEDPESMTSIIVIEPDAGQTESVAERLDAAALERWMADPANAPAVRGLFGSAAHPREPIAWSTDRRRYFYAAGQRIDSYDIELGKTKRIK